eukprot:c6795_g1_i1.p1 GENE.c6795_g1_i1~~c6795_g1_i1.p1  ORF type:complete len:105 (+),score=22.40 c6795_g1_i1:186-500(+)
MWRVLCCFVFLGFPLDKMLKLKSTDLLEFAMSFSGQMDLTADQLIASALDFKSVIPSIRTLNVSASNTALSALDVDLSKLSERYKDGIPFYLQKRKRTRTAQKI